MIDDLVARLRAIANSDEVLPLKGLTGEAASELEYLYTEVSRLAADNRAAAEAWEALRAESTTAVKEICDFVKDLRDKAKTGEMLGLEVGPALFRQAAREIERLHAEVSSLTADNRAATEACELMRIELAIANDALKMAKAELAELRRKLGLGEI